MAETSRCLRQQVFAALVAGTPEATEELSYGRVFPFRVAASGIGNNHLMAEQVLNEDVHAFCVLIMTNGWCWSSLTPGARSGRT